MCALPSNILVIKFCWPVLFVLEHHSFLSFTMRSTNYNQIENKTGLKGILEQVPPRTNTSKASQNGFTFVLQSHKVRGDLKRL